jgi:hypothetical protein
MDFDSLIGREVDFYGVDNNRFRLGVTASESVTFEAIEDPNDGYRSMMEEIRVVTDGSGIFFRYPIARVRIERVQDSFAGYLLRDVARDHVWLKVGTSNTGDYYPYFTFDYTVCENFVHDDNPEPTGSPRYDREDVL